MLMGSYRFEGDPKQLSEAYEKLLESLPTTNMQLQVCVTDDNGMTIYDTCPSKEVFLSFSSSADMKDMMTSAGLPAPTVTQIGPVFMVYSGGQRTV